MDQDQSTNPRKAIIRATASQRRKGLILFLLMIIGLGSLSAAEALHFDIGRLFNPCGFKQRYHLPCPTCGFTTAARAFARGRIGLAFYTQPAAGFVCLMLVFAALTGLFIAVCGIYPRWVHRTLSTLTPQRVFWTLLLIVLLGWAVTLTRAWRLNQM